MWTSNKKKYLFFLSIVLIIGFVCGIFFLNGIEESSCEIVLNNINNWVMTIKDIHVNNILSHLLLLSLFIVISPFCIGMPLFIFYIFYNGFSLSFAISSLSRIFGFKGILYGFIYVFLTKGIYIFLLLFFTIFLLKIGEKSFLRLIHKENRNIKEQIILLFKKCLLLLFLIFINDIFLYFFGGKLLNIFNFLIF